MKFTVRDLPASERPRERLEKLGSQTLSLQELLEVILGQGGKKHSISGIAHSLIQKYGSLESLSAATVEDLRDVGGVGYAKATQIKAAFELGKRYYLESSENLGAILTSMDAYKLARYYLKGKKQEYLMLFCLDVHGRLILKPEVISIGILDCSLIHPREIFNIAINNNSSKIILAHNHPSGSSIPSAQDYQVTSQVFQASKIIAIELIDHIVLGNHEFTSIREQKPEIFETSTQF